MSKHDIEAIQTDRFLSLWNYLWKNNEFYRNRFIEAGIEKQDVQAVADIAKIPILTKSDIRQNGCRIISAGYSKDQLLHYKTGGSTGKALDIYITEECSEQRNACARRHDRWTGWEQGEYIGAAWGNPKKTETIREFIINTCLQPYIYLDTMSVTEQAVSHFVKEWKAKQPTLLFGHAHSLYILANMIEDLNLSGVHPKGIISTSMMLLPHERKKIEEVFLCKVTDRYGCEEVSLIASECERHEGMHLNIEHLVIEIIREDGTAADVGEPGRIIVTDLMNMAMPFVRYQVEDIGILLDRECSCGRALPLMGPVQGRIADFLIKNDGTKIAGISIIENTLTKLNGIDQLQIIQESLKEFNINIVPGSQYNEGVKKDLIDYFITLFGSVTININECKEIQPEKSGKYRFTICKIKVNSKR
jgi:phenylacetate-CoA ligase